LGLSVQEFCQGDGQKRSWIKEALGLPRKIGLSNDDGQKQRGYSSTYDKQSKEIVVWLGQKHAHRGDRDPKDMRHASPVNDDLGMRFESLGLSDHKRSQLNARNDSILAHGKSPISSDGFTALFEPLLSLIKQDRSALPVFPTLVP
jgi:hypothetical protein